MKRGAVTLEIDGRAVLDILDNDRLVPGAAGQDQSLKLEPRSHTKVVAAALGIEAAASYIG